MKAAGGVGAAGRVESKGLGAAGGVGLAGGVVKQRTAASGSVVVADRVGIKRLGAESGVELGEQIARRTARLVRLEGGNDLVYQPLIRARLGMLDLNWFKGEVRYSSLPNGITNDRVRQVGGRYNDSTNFDFMMNMGVWTENLSLPAVLNECMMQSYTGTIRLFPNTQNLGPARFQNLRAAGAFLVSATYDGQKIRHVSLLSEKGKTVRLAKPWSRSAIQVAQVRDGRSVPLRVEEQILVFDTEPGEQYRIEPAG